MIPEDKVKGMHYNMTFSPQPLLNTDKNFNNSTQAAIIGYMNEKIKCLEIENSELKKEVSMKCNDKDKINYYLRLRKELLEEIERLKNEKSGQEIFYTTEIEKMKEEIHHLVLKLNLSLEEVEKWKTQAHNSNNRSRREEEMPFTSTQRQTNISQTKSPIKFFPQSDNDMMSNFSQDNFFLNPNSGKEVGKNYNNFGISSKELVEGDTNANTKGAMNFSSMVSNINQLPTPHESKQSLQNNNPNLHNPFVQIINELEERINQLETAVREKDTEIFQLQETKLKDISQSGSEIDTLKLEIETWKQKYISVLSSKKSLSQEFQDLNQKQVENYKIQTDKNLYELEKKILHLEKMNGKYELDIEKISRMSAETINTKQLEVESLKENLKTVITNYEQLYKCFEENLKTLTKQLDSMKQLYIARETEFINITKYYTETINDYSKPITEMNSNTNFKKMEEDYIVQSKELLQVRVGLESYVKENTNIRTESIESKPKLRQKISDAMRLYDENIKNIVENHNSLENKLSNILNFMDMFENKFIFFASLIEDNKRLEEKVNILECNMKMINIESKDLEILALKDNNFKLSKESEVRLSLLKEYEELLKVKENNTLNNTTGRLSLPTSSSPNKRRKDTSSNQVSDEIVFKLKSEIALLSNQVIALNKSKDSIEKFYQIELKNAVERANDKSEKIEDLKTIIRKMENDFTGKKETIFNLWMLEFKEFKQNLITIDDIKSIVEKFKIEGEELTLHKDRVYSEELYILRNEMKIKDDLFNDLKNNLNSERKNFEELVEGYKKTFNNKINTYDMLIKEKQMEVASLKNEKSRLEGVENAKRTLTEEEMKNWNEQRDHIRQILVDHSEAKNKEIITLKQQQDILQKELDNSRKLNEANLQNVINSIEQQLSLFKERELFTVGQLLEIEQRFTSFREEKDRTISILREEIQEIKNHNLMLGKIKSDRM